ncbi:tomoregulin-2-like [Pecten maximus]|uniref:tomoregulin-2-like n=1 Tax=Pecten maximus TaxID=6579 RepID=UPI001458F1C5|nr:tomoregulin-2-like [Pecten maximus]
MDHSAIMCVILTSIIHVSRGMPADATQMCSDVLGLDCSTDYIVHGEEVLCGTNGVTYKNKCFHVQARCNDVTINKAYDGKCQNDVTTSVEMTTTKSDTTMTQSEVNTISSEYEFHLNEEFCNNSLNEPCPDVLDPLCGTDFKFYQNVCEFQKVKCVDRDLELQPLSNCKEGQR